MLAYREPDYEKRLFTEYKPGDRVEVGPAYRMGGTYVPDGHEGIYVVVERKRCGRYFEYKLAREARGNAAGDWDIMIMASRLQAVQS